jgi:cytochrome c oxidase subunit II
MNGPIQRVRRLLAATSSMALAATPALAQGQQTAALTAPGADLPVLGAPHDWQMVLQPAYSPVKAEIISLNHLVLVIIGLITALVAGLLLWVIVRYNAKRHPVPTQTTHNTVIEITWTVVPVLILVIIAIPSFRLVYYEDRTYDPDMTIKVTGHQWYWEYTYPDQKNLDFMSNIVPDDKLKAGQPRLLTADNPLVLPVNKNIRILTTSGDVIHSFFVPALGVQRYAIPGRTIETWVRIDRPGIYYGECNQICGTNHSRMPIDVVALPDAQFQAWVTQAQKQFAADATPVAPAPTRTAEAATKGADQPGTQIVAATYESKLGQGQTR